MALRFSSSSARAAVSVGVAPGKTSKAKPRFFPSRERTKAATSSGNLLTWVASPPSAGMRQTCELPDREEMKKICEPSGDQRGLTSASGWEVKRRRLVPSTLTSQRSVRPRLASRSVVRIVKTTRFPSGEALGSLMRSMANMSWTEKGCVLGSAARAAQPACTRMIAPVIAPWVGGMFRRIVLVVRSFIRVSLLPGRSPGMSLKVVSVHSPQPGRREGRSFAASGVLFKPKPRIASAQPLYGLPEVECCRRLARQCGSSDNAS